MLFRLSAFALALFAPGFAAADAARIEKALRQIENSRSLPENLRRLCEEIGPRMAGTAGMRRAAAWARRAFEKAGVDSAAVEPVPMPLRWKEGKTSVVVLGGQNFPIRAASSALSPAAPRGGIEAEAAYAGTGAPGRILRRSEELRGKLLLIRLREVHSFEGLAVEQRGAMVAMREAAEIGAAGVVRCHQNCDTLTLKLRQRALGAGVPVAGLAGRGPRVERPRPAPPQISRRVLGTWPSQPPACPVVVRVFAARRRAPRLAPVVCRRPYSPRTSAMI